MKRDGLDKKLAAYLGDVAKRFPGTTGGDADGPAGVLEGIDPVVAEIVRSFLMWDAPRPGVAAALERLGDRYVDVNELRIALPEEVASTLGARYPGAEERCLRLRAALHEVFVRENGLTLEQLRDQPKRAARAYLDSLPGITTFVAARVALLCCEAHAFPVDRVLLGMLADAGAAETDESPEDASARLERSVRAGDAAGLYAGLERAAMMETGPRKKATARRTRSASASSKSAASKKTSGKRAGKPK